LTNEELREEKQQAEQTTNSRLAQTHTSAVFGTPTKPSATFGAHQVNKNKQEIKNNN